MYKYTCIQKQIFQDVRFLGKETMKTSVSGVREYVRKFEQENFFFLQTNKNNHTKIRINYRVRINNHRNGGHLVRDILKGVIMRWTRNTNSGLRAVDGIK